MSSPKATVAIVPRERFGFTRQNLERILEKTSRSIELIYVDGGSPEHVCAYLEDQANRHDFFLLRSNEYLTPNEARNLAAHHVRTPYVVFVDNDVLVADDWLPWLVDCAEQTGAWVVGPLYCEREPEATRIHMFGGEARIVERNGHRSYHEIHHWTERPVAEVRDQLVRQPTEIIEFHTTLVRMEAFDQLGALDEGLMCSSEHFDLCLGTRTAGATVYLEPRSVITYVPPRYLEADERDYFELRWSEAWSRATIQRLREKWNLSARDRGLKLQSRFVAFHRRLGLDWFRNLKRKTGRKVGRLVEWSAVDPIERLMNRRKFPLTLGRSRVRPNSEVASLGERRAA